MLHALYSIWEYRHLCPPSILLCTVKNKLITVTTKPCSKVGQPHSHSYITYYPNIHFNILCMGQDKGNNLNPMHCTRPRTKSYSNNVTFIHIQQLWMQLLFKRSGWSWRRMLMNSVNVEKFCIVCHYNTGNILYIIQKITPFKYWICQYSIALLKPAATIYSCTEDLWVRHHGMARPQDADRGMASDMEGSCE